MLDAVFGELSIWVKFFLAFLVCLGLMGGLYYAVRRFGSGALSVGTTARGRQPRLALIDTAIVDTRRRLVLIRRDNVEHLIMIGGPTDVVIEPNIVRAAREAPHAREAPPAREAAPHAREAPPVREAAPPLREAPPVREAQPAREPQPAREAQPAREPQPAREAAPSARETPPGRTAAAITNIHPRAVPLNEGAMWPLQPEPMVRPQRPPADEEEAAPERPAPTELPQRAAAEAPPRTPNPDRLAGLAMDLSHNFHEADAPPRRNPEPRRPAPQPVPAITESDEQNLAEMAQRLESALQRPKVVSEPAAAAPPPPARSAAPVVVPAEPRPLRAEPKAVARPEPKQVRPEPKPVPKAAFDSLEQEMASLLGRPSGKT